MKLLPHPRTGLTRLPDFDYFRRILQFSCFMMRSFFLVLLVLLTVSSRSQDTIRVMYHNLLNFGYITSFCTVNNNDPEDKSQWMKTIVDHYLPDVLAVNEIGTDPFYHHMILNDVMNTSGRDHYQMSEPTNFAGSDIINMLYYNSDKVGLAGGEAILTTPRDINVYKLYHKSESLHVTFDTSFFYFIVAHLKAGPSGSDQQERAEMVQQVIGYLENNNITEPVLFAGDFNLYTSAEPAWSILTDGAGEDFRFSDPLDMAGDWHQNPDFAAVHTQSTRTQSGCGAGGGLDDRFDFMLTNPFLTTSSQPVSYIDGSYTIPGQDGQRLNGSLIDPPNNSLPADIINALYNFSDHLPVVLDLLAFSEQLPFCTDLFFSEYIEGTGNNKALEIFNPTPVPVDLSGYLIARYANGSFVADTVGLAGIIQPGETYVVVVDQRDPEGTGFNTPVDSALMAVADTFLCPDYSVNPTMYFNGNDAMALQRNDGALVDLIGKIGENPGSGWTSDSLCTQGHFTALCGASAWTADQTLVRKFGAAYGTNINPPFFNPAAEWIKLPVNTFDSLGYHRSACKAEAPPSWAYTQTLYSHIVTVPLNSNPAIQNKKLDYGDFIGLFYRDGHSEQCAGYVQWKVNENTVLVAYGDDPTTSKKDGFIEGDDFYWRVFSADEQREFEAEAEYDSFWPQSDGTFVLGGISALSNLNGQDELLRHQLELEHGWTGISLPLQPKWPLLNDVFGADTVSVDFMSDGNAVYQPGMGINEIVSWESTTGYFAKASPGFDVLVKGYDIQNKTIELQQGWNILPVFSGCPVSVYDIELALNGKLDQIKEIAGVNVYWPGNSVSTLAVLKPGGAYFIKLTTAGSYTFEDCD
jgi:endonuclease/exonuclease/phosphatase family metal-dependent hydrolase